MVDDNDHGAAVDAWMERSAKQLPADEMLDSFERAFAAMWGRAHQTLGDVTLTAIVDRVLYVAAERYPILASLTVDVTGLRCDELRQHLESPQSDRLAEGVRFILVEFLTVLGNLTAEILTPALHGELSKVAPDSGGLPDEGSAGESPNPQREDGEGEQS